MLKSLTNLIKKRDNQGVDQESGLSLPEVLIASVIIVLVLVFTALGLTSSFGISNKTENANKATQAINEQMAIAKQATYADLGLMTPTAEQAKGCATWATTFNGEKKVIASANYPSLDYCTVKQYSDVGISYYIETQITYVSTTTFDGSTQSVPITSTGYEPKRVTVTVRWADSVNSSGVAVQSSRSMTWVKTPSIQDCIPPGLNTTPANGSCIGA